MGKVTINYDVKRPSADEIKIAIEEVYVVLKVKCDGHVAQSARADTSTDDSCSESDADDDKEFSVGDQVMVQHKTNVPRSTTWCQGTVTKQMKGAFLVKYRLNKTTEPIAQFKSSQMQKMDTSLFARLAPARRAKAYFQTKMNEATSTLVENIKFTIEDVHIRLEGHSGGLTDGSATMYPGDSGSGGRRVEYALGMTVDKIIIDNDEELDEKHKRQFTRKVIRLGATDAKRKNSAGFAVYCNDTAGLGSSDKGKALSSPKATSSTFKHFMHR